MKFYALSCFKETTLFCSWNSQHTLLEADLKLPIIFVPSSCALPVSPVSVDNHDTPHLAISNSIYQFVCNDKKTVMNLLSLSSSVSLTMNLSSCNMFQFYSPLTLVIFFFQVTFASFKTFKLIIFAVHGILRILL